jgi:hypothetical protein
MNWEQVDNYTQRAKVVGGWIVKVSEDVIHYTEYNGLQSGWDWRIAICFVPDQNYSWKLEE